MQKKKKMIHLLWISLAGFCFKLNMHLPYVLPVPILDIFLRGIKTKQNKTHAYSEISMQNFTAVLFIIT